jgi:hypothetical protein
MEKILDNRKKMVYNGLTINRTGVRKDTEGETK